jgi:hypothetical protein
MKSKLLALALVAGSLSASNAFAESRITAVPGTATGAISATARLDFSILVPKILYLKVGTAGAAIDAVQFAVSLTGITVPSSDAVFAGPPSGAFTSVGTNTSVGVNLWTNNGSANLNCAGAALTSGSNSIALSSITVSNATGGGLGHPGASLACTSASRGSAGFNNLSDTWTFAYAPATLPAAGNYTTQVTYTASQP